ncbi:hypothetical protein FB567DRAFT_129429 [Paraphoma chrysanthemicola]|uniref:Uncharacterized protein n=1 Tax=Paraphoma chrysanthemicola TaxID=798071 RepID=A0A8K0VUJ4_9PLEO|nr:hypothetical protein FB567DRAFT_129429 [Paraphoma chrysanthemicola]
MLLPPELLTLILLASAVTALPQQEQATNVTLADTKPASTPVDTPDGGSGFVVLDPEDDLCAKVSCAAWLRPSLPTATGWEDGNDIVPTPIVPDEPKPPRVLVTQTPTIIDIQTNTGPTSLPGNGGNGNNQLRPASNAVTSYSVRPGIGPAVPAQETPGSNLLLDIISRIGDTEQPAPPTPVAALSVGTQTDNPAQLAQVTPGPKAASDVNNVPIQAAQATLPLGGMITAGSATLTLTPGLSTTIGTGNGATFIGIVTNSAGQTLITVSASGTATTATVAIASATLTLSGTGFGASITDVARPGDYKISSAGRAAAATSSKAGASNLGVERDTWSHVLLGLVGIGMMLQP